MIPKAQTKPAAPASSPPVSVGRLDSGGRLWHVLGTCRGRVVLWGGPAVRMDVSPEWLENERRNHADDRGELVDASNAEHDTRH